MKGEISAELKNLVGNALEVLGKAIHQEYGQKTYHHVESIRKKFKKARDLNTSEALKVHAETLKEMKSFLPQTRFDVAHSFAISLELINACENAYRSYRIQQKNETSQDNFSERITYVLTAHPTESRSPECIQIFTQLTQLLVELLQKNRTELSSEIYHLILISLKTPVARTTKPDVIDEAEYIYSIVLRKELLLSLIENAQNAKTVFIRTWVGGDKDGHPGIDAAVMRQSLELSRTMLLSFTLECLKLTQNDLELLDSKESTLLHKKISQLLHDLKKAQRIRNSDGKLIQNFRKSLSQLDNEYLQVLGVNSPQIAKLNQLLFIFPGLVVPLELRESSTLIREAYLKKRGAIHSMLKNVQLISQGGESPWYVRALVISTTESADDIRIAEKLVRRTMLSQRIPVVPLFESRHSLESSKQILEDLFADAKFLKLCKKEWASRFEIMLGYSDSAKENGALLSRVLIRDALFELEDFLESKSLVPIFFHGSGGSVARGGGSLEEQVSWWPISSRKLFKITLQGEMVYRSFSRPEIFNKQVTSILSNSLKQASNKRQEQNPDVKNFALKVADEYQKLIFDPRFLKVVEKSTPYLYLNELKIGSRPTKRTQELGITSLRAIPWVLCWTQMRALLPIWWGIGTTWENLPAKDRKQLVAAFKNDPFFTSFIKLLAFSVAKVDLSIWFSYLHHTRLEKEEAELFQKIFSEEFEKTLSFIRELTEQKEILWFRPWLESSIKLRSTMIHPLNMAQIVALEKSESALLRESVTGIASGMLTTG